MFMFGKYREAGRVWPDTAEANVTDTVQDWYKLGEGEVGI